WTCTAPRRLSSVMHAAEPCRGQSSDTHLTRTLLSRRVEGGVRRATKRRQPPAAERDERREEPYHHWYQRWRELTACRCDHRRANHDEHQPGRSQWCQARAYAQEPGEDQAERAEHLGHADAS